MTILCIDDDPEDIELLCEAVRSINPMHRCIVSENGKDALSTLIAVYPDFIFLDINMPVMNGSETLRWIRANHRFKEIPIYILSTTSDPREIATYKKLGATGFLVKPNTFKGLCNILKPLL